MRVLTVLTLAAAAAASAHEIGTTRVTAVFHDAGTYDVEIVTDAMSLAEKLASVSGQPAPTGSLDRLPGFEQSFVKRLKLSFDAAGVRPSIGYSIAPPADAVSAPIATIRLTGAVPAGAREFTWTYGWTFASYALIVKHGVAGRPSTVWLEGGRDSEPMPLAARAPAGRFRIAWRYLTLGFTHIVPLGLDHVLFVLGIYLLSDRARSVLWQVSAFTVAHSITLGLSMYGVVTASPRIVEPLIAVSIAYVAVENLFVKDLKAWRVALVFGFGLLHGMGFAGALQELGLPRSEFATALLTFNVGVEAGQLAVIAIAFALVGWQWNRRDWYRRRVVVPASLVIACTAAYWTVERLSF